MKKLTIISSLILLLSSNAFAELIYLTLEEHIKESDLVIVGKLTKVSEPYYGTTGSGIIEVEKVLTPNVKTNKGFFLKPNDKLQIEWDEYFACVIGWHKRTENQIGIWILKIEDDGIVSAFHPGKFVSLSELENVKSILKKRPPTSQKSVFPINKSYLTQDAILRALLVLIIALILYRLLYRARFKIKVRKEKKEKKE